MFNKNLQAVLNKNFLLSQLLLRILLKIVIKNIPTNKVTGGGIPNVLKQSGFTYVMLRDSINDCILKGTFPDSLKLANITAVHKKDEPKDKENYRLVSPYYQNVLKD